MSTFEIQIHKKVKKNTDFNRKPQNVHNFQGKVPFQATDKLTIINQNCILIHFQLLVLKTAIGSGDSSVVRAPDS